MEARLAWQAREGVETTMRLAPSTMRRPVFGANRSKSASTLLVAREIPFETGVNDLSAIMEGKSTIR